MYKGNLRSYELKGQNGKGSWTRSISSNLSSRRGEVRLRITYLLIFFSLTLSILPSSSTHFLYSTEKTFLTKISCRLPFSQVFEKISIEADDGEPSYLPEEHCATRGSTQEGIYRQNGLVYARITNLSEGKILWHNKKKMKDISRSECKYPFTENERECMHLIKLIIKY